MMMEESVSIYVMNFNYNHNSREERNKAQNYFLSERT